MVTQTFPRENWHVHIGVLVIVVAWGEECPGDDCDGLTFLP